MEITASNHSLEYSHRDRAQYIAVLCISSLVLAVARLLQPAANGVGTHQQLGLPPCYFLLYTGIPCPACGLTTSFAHTVRFHFYEAFITQPFGFIACLATMLLIPLCLYLLYRRVLWTHFLAARSTKFLMYFGIALMAAGWVYKIVITR